jgi:drug/metabolite transporter (DMT)-like permease
LNSPAIPAESPFANPTPRTVTLLMVAATLAVSMAPVLIVMCGKEIGTSVIAASRLLGITALMLPFAWPKRHELSKLSRNEWWALIGAGVSFGAHFLTFTAAFRYTSYESVVILLAAQPIIAAFVGKLLIGERTSRGAWIAIGVSMLGMLALVGEDLRHDLEQSGDAFDGRHLYGDLLVVAAGLFVVLTITAGRRLRQKLSLSIYTAPMFGVAGVTALSFALLNGERFVLPDWEPYFWVGTLILVPTICGHTLFNYLVKHVRIIYINMVILAEPVISMIAKWLINDPVRFEKADWTPLKVAGAVTLILSVAIGLILREKTGPASGSKSALEPTAPPEEVEI